MRRSLHFFFFLLCLCNDIFAISLNKKYPCFGYTDEIESRILLGYAEVIIPYNCAAWHRQFAGFFW